MIKEYCMMYSTVWFFNAVVMRCDIQWCCIVVWYLLMLHSAQNKVLQLNKELEDQRAKLERVAKQVCIRNRVDCQRSEKRSKTHKRLKERFLIRRSKTKHANFQGKPLFQTTYNNTTENSWFDSFLLLYVAWKRGFPQKFARFVLFHLIEKRSFNLLCVFDPGMS